MIQAHNEQVTEDKRFEVGIVTVTDPNDSLYRYTNYNSTMKELKEDLVDDLGGYLRVRNHLGHKYLDYVTDFGNTCTQVIEFGENLLDFTQNFDATNIATAIIPLGAKLETSQFTAIDERQTIKEVNDGKDYVYSEDAVKQYGWIFKTMTWDAVNNPKILMSKGKKYLTDTQFENVTIEAKAIDLHLTDAEIEQFLPSCFVRCHVSYYINMNHIRELCRYEMILHNGKSILISQRRYKDVENAFFRFTSDKL